MAKLLGSGCWRRAARAVTWTMALADTTLSASAKTASSTTHDPCFSTRTTAAFSNNDISGGPTGVAFSEKLIPGKGKGNR